MNRGQMSKSESQRIHAKRRAKERYGITLTTSLYNDLVSLINGRRRNAILVLRNSLTRGVYLLPQTPYGKLLVAYDRKRGMISTFLPHNLIKNVEENLHNVQALELILDPRSTFSDDDESYTECAHA